MKRVFVLLFVVFNSITLLVSESQTTTTDDVVTNGNRFGESQSLRQPHSLDDLLQREEWRDELVTLSLSRIAPETDTSKKKSNSEGDQSKDMCDVYDNYDTSTLAELFLPIQTAFTNIYMEPIEPLNNEDLELLNHVAERDDLDLAEFHGPYCSVYKVDGLRKEDLKIADSATFRHRPRISSTINLSILRQFVSWGLLVGHEPERILRLAALYWWIEGSAAESIHCLQRLVVLTEDHEQRRNARFMIGQTFALCELFDLAIPALEVTAYDKPLLWGPHFVLAGVRAYTGDYDGALQDYKRYVQLYKMPSDGHRLMAIKYCKCKKRELNRLKDEQEKLEKELSELNEFNDAMERKLQLQLLIQQKSSREREVINGFLTYNFLKHGSVPGIRCSGIKTEKNREKLSCKISNPIEFVKAGLRVHNEFQESLGDLSEHQDLMKNYETHRESQESEYALEMEPFLENLKPYVGLRMDGPVNAVRYPKLKDFDLSAKRNIDKLCSSRSSSTISRNSTTIFIDLNSRGYPVGDLLNKYLGLTPLDVHPLPWDMPFCKPWSIEDEKSKLWAMLKSPHTILKSPGLYMPELDLIPVLSSFMQHPNRRDFLLADFGQRVRSLMKYEIGPRWLLVELAAMFWRASGMFNEALACIAENLYGAEPIHTANIDISLFQLVRMLIRARSVEGTASDVALLMKIAILNLHVSDPAVLCLAALTAPTTEQSLFYLWQAYEIDDEYAPAVLKLEEHYCKRKVTFGRPIQDLYQPICCWQTEHDVYCFKRPDLEGSCFKIETKIVDDKVEHVFKSFRCSGTYVAKSYVPPPIALFAIGFMRPALQIRDQQIENKINQIFQVENEKKRKIEKQKLAKVLPLDYGGFSYKRMAEYSQLNEINKLQTRIDEYVDPEYAKKNAERIERSKVENVKPKEKEVLRTFDGEIVEFNEDERILEDLPPLDHAEPLWHEVIRYDNPLPIKLPQPSQKLYQKGLELFNVNEIFDLKRQCAHANLPALIEPVSTYVSISAKGFNISSVIDLKSPLPANINMNSVPICPESSNSIPIFDHMAAYKYRDQFTWYQPEKGLRDALLSLGNPQDTVDTIGVRLSEAIKRFRKSKDDVELHWAISAIAALYFRVKGDAINAVMCLRHSLANAPNDMKEIAAISLANVYHQAGFLNSALLSADYALRASNETIVAVHFTLANIYTSLNNYELANRFYYSTIALQSNFQAAKDRITALHFAAEKWLLIIIIRFLEKFNHYCKGVQLPRELIVIGAGNMAGCMVSTFVEKGCFAKDEVILVTKSEESAEIWRAAGYLRSCSLDTFIESRNALESAHRILLLAVKPQIRHELYVKLRMSGYVLKAEIVCSILAGVTHEMLTKEIEGIFIGPLIRLTPNVPSAVGSGVTLLYGPNENANDVATQLLRSTGEVIPISEKYFNCASAITGSGPAFVINRFTSISDTDLQAFLMIDALADGAVLNGIPRETATRMAALMLRGASDLILQSGKHPGQLKDQVCSPGVRSGLIEAVNETTRRANHLSGS
ncbi:Tetratricopeptide repeat protein 17 [Aphelenchoides besseyi]|nr:Tetratricopeptide repeat protein 17 [Aphelenchoides besseyi]